VSAQSELIIKTVAENATRFRPDTDVPSVISGLVQELGDAPPDLVREMVTHRLGPTGKFSHILKQPAAIPSGPPAIGDPPRQDEIEHLQKHGLSADSPEGRQMVEVRRALDARPQAATSAYSASWSTDPAPIRGDFNAIGTAIGAAISRRR
jgi:hypothetical protein